MLTKFLYNSKEENTELGKIISEEIDNATKNLINITSDQQLTEQQKMLKMANTFLVGLEKIEPLIKELENIYKILQHKRHLKQGMSQSVKKDKIESEYKTMNDLFWASFTINTIQQALLNMYSLIFAFQEGLNNILNQKIKVVYVANGRNLGAYEISSVNYLKLGFSKEGNLIGRYYILQKDLDNMKKINEDIAPKFSQEGLDVTYKEVLWRYNKAREKTKKSKSNFRMVLWKINNIWNGVNVTSRGDLSEAYSGYIIKNKSLPSFKNNLEINIKDFMTNAFVDSVSGILVGDIRTINTEDDKNIEYAIKSSGASALGIQQFKELALKIQQGLIINKDDLEEEQIKMIEKGEKHKHFTEYSIEQGNNELNSLIEDIEKHIVKK